MNYKIEVIILPVSDVDRALAFSTNKPDSRSTSPTSQATTSASSMTPPGASCSIQIGVGLTG